MTHIPDEIDAYFHSNDGFEYEKDETFLLIELIEKYNDLRNYVKEMMEPLL